MTKQEQQDQIKIVVIMVIYTEMFPIEPEVEENTENRYKRAINLYREAQNFQEKVNQAVNAILTIIKKIPKETPTETPETT